jgi:ribosomal RNA-processing protein 12
MLAAAPAATRQAARQQVLGSDPALQKKGYKVLAWLAEQRPTWLATAAPELLTLLLTTSTKTASSARRFRLRVLRPLILLLEAPGGDACPQLQLPAGLAGAAELASPEAAVRQAAVLRALVGELVLGIKEINVKTRTAAYELLVELAHELDEARPPSLGPAGADSDMEEEEEYGAANSAQQRAQQDASTSSSGGGLMDFVQLILGGLVGSTPHMQSAAVMALARLTYEFAGALEGLVPQLLPAILLLLRSNSREVVRSVLGYLKVWVCGGGGGGRCGGREVEVG